LAVVGSRKATEYGLGCARHFARRAGIQGYTVISGGAIGCDQAAHLGALDAGAKTVVVLGCGADVVYPKRAKALFTDILEQGGVIVSEAPWGSPPLPWAFWRRNRLIAGLALATLIIEAGLPSGTFSTADATLAQGKELLAVPGSIFSQQSKGANHLISQGAFPVIDDASLDAALANISSMSGLHIRCETNERTPCLEPSLDTSALVRNSDSPLARHILEQLQAKEANAEDLAESISGIPDLANSIVEVLCCLSHLELQGRVKRMPDGRFAIQMF
jgi:DNA processing protein